MKECNTCIEKEKEIKRILKAYKKDKIVARKLLIVMGAALLLTTAFGKEGIKMLFDVAKEWIMK